MRKREPNGRNWAHFNFGRQIAPPTLFVTLLDRKTKKQSSRLCTQEGAATIAMITLDDADDGKSSDDEEVQFLGIAAGSSPPAARGEDGAPLIRADAGDGEVVFAGVKGSGRKRRRSTGSSAPSVAAASRNDASLVEFVGTRRPRHSEPPGFGGGGGLSSAVPGLAQQQRNRRPRSFGGRINRAGEETTIEFHNPMPPLRNIQRDFILHGNAPITLPGPGAAHTYGHVGYHPGGGRGKLSSSKKRKADKHNAPAEMAMEKGKRLAKPQGFDAIDIFYPKLKANERTLILYNLLQSTAKYSACSHSKKFVNEWRVKFERSRAKATLWDITQALCNCIVKLDDETRSNLKLPARTLGGQRERTVNENEDVKLTATIGPVSGEVLDTLQTYFIAYLDKSLHKATLDAIGPKEGDDCITCSICADTFDPQHTVACTGDELHFFCKPCLEGYCTLTVQKGAIQSMPCPMPSCESLFATQDVKSTLSSWDVLRIERREDAINRRVATAAKAMLHCECGVVAIITEEDMGDGRVTCPGAGCGRRYCAKCGNDDHGTAPCPPPAETVQWLEKNSKECPNCRNRIEKAGGCDHMTCHPSAGGCGHEFWWTCGCPYRGEHTCGLRR